MPLENAQSTIPANSYTMTCDPGLVAGAYTIFNSSGAIVESNTFKFNTKLSQCIRLQILYSTLLEASKRYPLESVITEYQFMSTMTCIVGSIMTFVGTIPGVRFEKYTPSAWTKAFTGKGNTSADDLKKMVVEKFPEAIDYDEHRIDTVGIYLAYLKLKDEPPKPKKKKTTKKVELEANVIPKVIKKRGAGSKPG